MSLNQPNPARKPSFLDRAKQTVAAAKGIVEKKAHDVLPATLAGLTLGERVETHQRSRPGPAYPRYKPLSPEGVGIVEPDIRSASSSDVDSSRSWEDVPRDPSPETMTKNKNKPRLGERERQRAVKKGGNGKVNTLIDDLDSHFQSTYPD